MIRYETTVGSLPVDILEPPVKIKCIATKKVFTPVRYGIPQKGEYSWNLDLIEFSNESVITFNFCDGKSPSWIYEEIK